jgi:hypothetical protein
MYDEDEDWNEFLGLLDQFLWFAVGGIMWNYPLKVMIGLKLRWNLIPKLRISV